MHKHPLPSPQTQHLLVFSRSGAQLAINVLASSLSLLIDKTVKPACWNSLRRQVWRDRGLESNRWEPQQSNNLLSRTVLIKISPTTSPSPLWFKFIRSPLPQPPSDRSQRPCPPACSPRGTHSPSSLHSVRFQCSAGRRRCFGEAPNHVPVVLRTLAKRKRQRQRAAAIPWPSINWGRKIVTIIPGGVQKQDLTPRNTTLGPAVSKEKRLAMLPPEPIFMSCWSLPHLASKLPVIISGSKESSGQPSDALRKQLHWIKKTVHLCKKQYILFFWHHSPGEWFCTKFNGGYTERFTLGRKKKITTKKILDNF